MAVVSIDTDHLEEVKVAVSNGLTAYNDQFLPKFRERTPFAASIRDESGTVVGGLIGEFRLDWLYIDLLWVDESQRGKGHGEALLEIAEQEARKAGKTHIYLWTWSFQAPDFYQSQGFEECGRISNHPKGHDTVHYVKWLA